LERNPEKDYSTSDVILTVNHVVDKMPSFIDPGLRMSER
jgi:hypothetical protein